MFWIYIQFLIYKVYNVNILVLEDFVLLVVKKNTNVTFKNFIRLYLVRYYLKSLIPECSPLKKNKQTTFGSASTDLTHRGSIYDLTASLFKKKLTVFPDFGLGSFAL